MLQSWMATDVFDRADAGFGAFPFGDRDRAVQRHDRGRIQRDEQVIESHDLGPIGQLVSRRCGVASRNRGLQVVLGKFVAFGRGFEMFKCQVNHPPVPQRAILLGKQGQFPMRAGNRAA